MITELKLSPLVASPAAGISSLILVNRYSQKKKKDSNTAANMIKFFGGIDRANKSIDKYHSSIRKKCHSTPLLYCFELILQNVC